MRCEDTRRTLLPSHRRVEVVIDAVETEYLRHGVESVVAEVGARQEAVALLNFEVSWLLFVARDAPGGGRGAG